MSMRIATKTPYVSAVVAPKPRKPKAPPKPRAKFPEKAYAIFEYGRVTLVKDAKAIAPHIGGSREVGVYQLVGVKRISTVIEIKDVPVAVEEVATPVPDNDPNFQFSLASGDAP